MMINRLYQEVNSLFLRGGRLLAGPRAVDEGRHRLLRDPVDRGDGPLALTQPHAVENVGVALSRPTPPTLPGPADDVRHRLLRDPVDRADGPVALTPPRAAEDVGVALSRPTPPTLPGPAPLRGLDLSQVPGIVWL